MDEVAPEIQLPKTKLALRNGVLEKSDKNGTIVARHPLAKIASVHLVVKTDYAPIVMGLGVAALGVVAYQFVETPLWKWVAVIIMFLVAAIMFIVSSQQYVELKCGEDKVEYNLIDLKEENEGFVLSLKQALVQATPDRANSSL